ncbi:RNA-binding protein CP33, chloroplastic [Humulus lupulus]|uniref:RNA-binding protein CP33, chloroplastic n=1 Tax=Humulus lupulus TaxID=3486 RepID=UPI002B406364|nr:RNA-binding protein CP33, chloroplastic [Humulus lupulus]
MAATNAASSSSLCNKISNLSITHSLAPIPTRISTHYSKNLTKHLTLNTQFPNFASISLLSSPPHFRRFSSVYDGLELEDDTPSSDEECLEPEVAQVVGEEAKKPKVSGSGGSAGRLYVGSLPYFINSTQLAEVFAEAGNVISVEVIHDKVTDKSRGFGFVTMETFEEAKEAIRKFDGSQVAGRTIKVNFPEVPRGGEKELMGPKIREINRNFVDSPHKIYAGNLGWALTSQALKSAFATQPGVLSAKVIYERDTGRSRGFGFVTFETAEAAQSALTAMNGMEVEGRPLRLNIATDRGAAQASPPSPVVTEVVDNDELFAGVNS